MTEKDSEEFKIYDEEPVLQKTLDYIRTHKISRRNDLIQKSKYSLSLTENKAVLYITSKIKPNDEPGKLYRFYFNEFLRVINWNKASYNELKKLLQKLADKSIWITMEDDKESLVRWFDIVDTNTKGVGYFEISFHQRIYPYLFDLKKQKEDNGIYYTTYTLQNVTLMKHQYSSRIYEILKSYQFNNKKWIFEIGTGSKQDLQILISEMDSQQKSKIPTSWKNYAIFNRDVLKHAKEEINKYTDIKIDYIPSKTDLEGNHYRRYVSVEFYMIAKSSEEIEKTDTLIETEYRNTNSHQESEQLNLQKILFNEPEDVQKTVQCRFPLAQEIFTELLPEEIESLVTTAYGNIIGNISPDNMEPWAVDYISFYYKKLKATTAYTKTSSFGRLLDMVNRDYDNRAQIITCWHTEPEIVYDATEESKEKQIETKSLPPAYIVADDPDFAIKMKDYMEKGIKNIEILSREEYEERKIISIENGLI